MNIKFLFLDDTDTSGESQVFYCEEGMNLTLQAKNLGSGTLDVEVKGLSDAEEDDFTVLALTDLSSGETAEKIAAEGLYRVSLDGIMQIKVVNNNTAGEVKVFGVMSTRQ